MIVHDPRLKLIDGTRQPAHGMIMGTAARALCAFANISADREGIAREDAGTRDWTRGIVRKKALGEREFAEGLGSPLPFREEDKTANLAQSTSPHLPPLYDSAHKTNFLQRFGGDATAM